jgi:hypothetical protein
MENSKAKFHLFNIWALVDEFKAGQVDEELKFKYLLASAIFISLLLSLLIMPGEETQTVWWFDTVSSLLITILGIQLAYQKNKSGDNTDFVARYTAIGFVLTSLSLALYLAGFFLLGFVAGVLESAAFEAFLLGNAYFTSASTFIFTLIPTVFIIKYIGEVSHRVV